MGRSLLNFYFYIAFIIMIACGSGAKDRKPFAKQDLSVVADPDTESQASSDAQTDSDDNKVDSEQEEKSSESQEGNDEEEQVADEEEAAQTAAEEEAARIAAEEEAARIAAEEEAARIAAEEEAARIAAEEEAARIAAEEEAARIAAEAALAALAAEGEVVYNNSCNNCHPGADLASDPRLANKDQAQIDARLNREDGVFHPLVLNLQDGDTAAIAAAVEYLKLQAEKAAEQ